LVIVDAAWCGWVEFMISNEEQVRAAISEQAGEWLVANDDGPLNANDCVDLEAWLKASPVHVEEFLGVSLIARDLRRLNTDAEFSLERVLADARAEQASVSTLWPRVGDPAARIPARRWLPALVSMAALILLGLGLFSLWNAGLFTSATPDAATAMYATRHGEQMSLRLSDNSVLHLNTDSAVSIRYGKTERLVTLRSGEAHFEVTHDPSRPFRVLAGAAEVLDIGTSFDVRLEHELTVITVVEGRVAVGPAPLLDAPGSPSGDIHSPHAVQLGAGQQIILVQGAWPSTPVAVDAQRATAWLRRQIVFDQEPLERVAAEFNRYGPKPIEIVTPELRTLQISGVFATDDSEAFIAFLRSLKGVRVEITATRIRVSRVARMVPPDYT
jgi:transmembrane sensor